MSDYNGYADWTTWNVCLWIGNDYSLYQIARRCKDYDQFVAMVADFDSAKTPDGAKWRDANPADMAEFWADMLDAKAAVDAIETEQDDLDFLDSLEMELP